MVRVLDDDIIEIFYGKSKVSIIDVIIETVRYISSTDLEQIIYK